MKHPLIISTGPAIVDPNGGIFQPLAGSTVLQVEPQMLRNGERPYHDELQYLGLLKELVDKHEEDPTPREDRTGTGTFSVFGRQIRFDLSRGFPLLTTKRIFTKGVVAELLWMLAGSTNVKGLQEQGVHIWDEWADPDGELGPVYGKQWRDWGGYQGLSGRVGGGYVNGRDQIRDVITSIAEKPGSRRHIVTAWNPAEVDNMALPPCHMLFQFYVENGKLSCQLYQRSADIFLGVPFNIASYALLTHLIAREVGLEVGEFIHTFGDLHLYANHVEQAKEQLSRMPHEPPLLLIDGEAGIFNVVASDVQFIDYNPHPPIKGSVSV